MSDGKSANGSCFCGAVQFRVAFPTLFCAHCHCTMCRRAHGAGYVTWIGVPRPQLAVETGEADLRCFDSSDHGKRSFCGTCGSTLFFEDSNEPDRVDVVRANLHGEIDRAPQAHCFMDDRVHWVTLADDLPRLGGPTGLEPLD